MLCLCSNDKDGLIDTNIAKKIPLAVSTLILDLAEEVLLSDKPFSKQSTILHPSLFKIRRGKYFNICKNKHVQTRSRIRLLSLIKALQNITCSMFNLQNSRKSARLLFTRPSSLIFVNISFISILFL